MKSILLDGALRLNASAYRYKFDNLQVSAFDAATTSFNIINAASSLTTGVDVDSEWLPTTWLTLRASIGYNKGEFDNFPGAPCWTGQTAQEGCVGGVQDLSNHRRPQAPKWNTTTGFDITQPLGSGHWTLQLSADANYTGDISTQTADNPFARQDAFWRINTRVGLSSSDQRWDFALIGRNVTDEHYVYGSADKPGGIRGDVFAQALPGRELQLQATYQFSGPR